MHRLIEQMTGVVDDLYGHVYRVSTFAGQIGRAMGLPDEDIERLRTVGVLHDVGKIHIDPEIIAKPGPLCPEELDRMRRHPEFGFAMTIESFDRAVAEAVLYHHERWDGDGYPHRLVKQEIPMLARVIAVADAFDAITSDRAYQRALPVEFAVRELRAHAGRQFDPDCARVFAQLIEAGEIEAAVTVTTLSGVAV
jgi:HD-GYP domain-containing protein (c-di-GMP phosphodiesterase class II)